MRGALWCAVALALVPALAGAQEPSAPVTGGTCVECHLALDEPELSKPAQDFAGGVHDREGLGCTACHGGDPTAEDPEEAMDPARGFKGAPSATEVPALCGGCHSDNAFIRSFNPNLPTDQLAQYTTSVHGRRLASGDGKVATCISCHGVHGIRNASDPRSSVYPTHVVETCARCHADTDLMSGYGIQATQVEKYRRSVHYAALTEDNDLSAPTCNDCHGSHGATPPGVESVSNVCGVCHVVNMELYGESPHHEPFTEMEMGACEACHGNHEVVTPSDAWLGVGEDSVCGRCHEAGDPGGEVALAVRALLDRTVQVLDEAKLEVGDAERAGMLMEDSKVSLEDAHQQLVLGRTKVHLASVSAVEEHTSKAVESADSALADAARARDEISYRRHGLLVALIFILLAIVALVLKVRQIEG